MSTYGGQSHPFSNGRSPKIVVLAACFASVTLAGCGGVQSDFSGPNGYGIACDKSWDCLVIKGEWGSGDIIIEPEVDQFAMVDRFIIGHVVRQANTSGIVSPPAPPPPPALPQQPGYFIVDTQSGSKTTGLGEVDWNARLSALGIAKSQLQDTAYGAAQREK